MNLLSVFLRAIVWTLGRMIGRDIGKGLGL